MLYKLLASHFILSFSISIQAMDVQDFPDQMLEKKCTSSVSHDRPLPSRAIKLLIRALNHPAQGNYYNFSNQQLDDNDARIITGVLLSDNACFKLNLSNNSISTNTKEYLRSVVNDQFELIL